MATSLIAEAVKLSLSVLYTGFMAYSKILLSATASSSLFFRVGVPAVQVAEVLSVAVVVSVYPKNASSMCLFLNLRNYIRKLC